MPPTVRLSLSGVRSSTIPSAFSNQETITVPGGTGPAEMSLIEPPPFPPAHAPRLNFVGRKPTSRYPGLAACARDCAELVVGHAGLVEIPSGS